MMRKPALESIISESNFSIVSDDEESRKFSVKTKPIGSISAHLYSSKIAPLIEEGECENEYDNETYDDVSVRTLQSQYTLNTINPNNQNAFTAENLRLAMMHAANMAERYDISGLLMNCERESSCCFSCFYHSFLSHTHNNRDDASVKNELHGATLSPLRTSTEYDAKNNKVINSTVMSNGFSVIHPSSLQGVNGIKVDIMLLTIVFSMVLNTPTNSKPYHQYICYRTPPASSPHQTSQRKPTAPKASHKSSTASRRTSWS